MAVRALIVAAHGATPESFTEAFPALGSDEPDHAGDWVWGLYSLWGVKLSEVDAQALDASVMTISTSDDAMWFLRLGGQGREPFGMTSFHYLLDPDATEDIEEDTFREFLLELYEMVSPDLWPPPSVRSLKDDDPADALPEYLALQAHATLEALERFGIPHDRDAVMRALTGDGMDESDLESPVGTLPQFLEALGLGSVAEAFREDEEDDEDDDEDDEEPEEDEDDEDDEDEAELAIDEDVGEDEDEREDVAAGVLERTAVITPGSVEGGPVALASDAMHHVFLLPWFCDGDIDLAITCELPEGVAPPTWPERPVPTKDGDYDVNENELQIDQAGSRAQIGISWGSVWRRQRWLKAFDPAVRALPDGSVVTLHTADTAVDAEKDGEPVAGVQLYRGRVAGGVWSLEESWPVLDAKALGAALALVAEADDETPVTMRDADELKEVFGAAERGGLLAPLPEVDGLTLSHELKEDLLRYVFRARFRDHWPVAAGEAAEEEDAAEFGDLLNLFGGGEAEVDADAEVIYKGAFATYVRADPAAFDEPTIDDLGDALDEQLSAQRVLFLREVLGEESAAGEDEPEAAEDFDVGSLPVVQGAFEALGFGHIGDLASPKLPGVTVRGFAGVEGTAYGTHMRSPLVSGVVEFYTAFDDGSSLTTSTNDEVPTLPHKEIYGQALPDATPAALLEAHDARVAEMSAEGRSPQVAEPTLEGLAQTVDAFLVRQMG